MAGGRFTDERLYAYGDAALDGECGKVLSAPEGKRNATLFSAACNLFELVRGGSLEESRVRDHLTYAATATGLDAEEIGATLDSAAARATKARGPRERNGGHVASSGSGPAAQTDEPDRKPVIRLEGRSAHCGGGTLRAGDPRCRSAGLCRGGWAGLSGCEGSRNGGGHSHNCDATGAIPPRR